MKITDVACHILQCRVDKPFVSARGWVYGTRASCVVEIPTDEGITGWERVLRVVHHGETHQRRVKEASMGQRSPALV